MPAADSHPADAIDADALAEFRSAVRHDDRARVAALLEESPMLATATNRKGVSLLVEARLRGHSAIVARMASTRARGEFTTDELVALGDPRRLAEVLAVHDESADGFAEDGFAPLHRAAYLGDTEVVEALLSAGADASTAARNSSGILPAESARSGSRPELADRLTSPSPDSSAGS